MNDADRAREALRERLRRLHEEHGGQALPLPPPDAPPPPRPFSEVEDDGEGQDGGRGG